MFSLADLDPVSEREKAIDQAERSLTSAIEKKSDVITVSGTARSPELAQKMVAKFIDIYQGEHSLMHRTAGSHAFFAQQTDLLRKNLSDALAKLRKAGRVIATMDLLIAATAIVGNATLVTRNRKHFEHVPGLRLISY